ncbi:uncharacterized protein LOC121869903 [Homarus americanus]|uniref:Uncharacterized protein n=1 Tax=Homarus americanus TaxID=6706 RepID=A0A8J5K1V7_HOMAM|nr:uncharacterized protein LOC121869903 [Homarus americanus]KAG7165974.1 hypothetical protein Hamer_G011897 [Homarus americanus]
MVFKGMLVVLAALVAASHASETKQLPAEVGEEDPRLVFSVTNPNQSVVVANSGMVIVGLLVLMTVLAIVAVSIGARGRQETSSYHEPITYGAAPAYQEESTYAIHRSLDDAANKFQS